MNLLSPDNFEASPNRLGSISIPRMLWHEHAGMGYIWALLGLTVLELDLYPREYDVVVLKGLCSQFEPLQPGSEIRRYTLALETKDSPGEDSASVHDGTIEVVLHRPPLVQTRK